MAVGMRNWKSEAGTTFTHKADGAVRAPAVGAIRLGPSGLAVEAELLKRRSLSLPRSLSPGPLSRDCQQEKQLGPIVVVVDCLLK